MFIIRNNELENEYGMDLGKMGSSLKIYYNLDRLNVNILDRRICGIKGWE